MPAGSGSEPQRPSAAWSEFIRDQIAGAIRRFRKERGWTTHQLADELRTRAGVDISRSTIAKMESGERTAFTVPDLLAFAYALGVPPVSLVVPIGRAESFEIVPGQRPDIGFAQRWFTGESAIEDSLSTQIECLNRARRHDETRERLEAVNARAADLTADLEVLRRAEEETSRALERAMEALDEIDDEDDPAEYERRAAVSDTAQRAHESARSARHRVLVVRNEASRLRGIRRRIRVAKDVPPPLPESLAWIDRDGGDDDA